MSKKLTVKVGKELWRVMSGRLVLSDRTNDCGISQYNRPVIVLDLEHSLEESVERETITIVFQRHVYQPGDRAATSYMDTRRRWSESYAGTINLDSSEVRLFREYDFSRRDKLGASVLKKIENEIQLRNLHLLHSCECRQVVEAISYFSLYFEHKYMESGTWKTEDAIDLLSVKERFANRQAMT